MLTSPENLKAKAIGFFLPREASAGAAGAFLRRFYNLRTQPGADGETGLTGYAGVAQVRDSAE